MTDRIEISGLEVFAHHGVLESEAEDGQYFYLDVALDVDTSPAAAADDLSLTVDYGRLASELVELATSSRFQLIESLAHHLAAHCMRSAQVQGVTLTVHKPSAPIPHGFDDVSVRVRYPR